MHFFDTIIRMECLVLCLQIFMWIFITYKVIQNIERFACVFVRGQIPFVPSERILRKETVREILTHWPHAKTVVEIGAGYGGMARKIARQTGAKVYAIENMPFTFFMLRTLNLLTRTHGCTAIRADAFKYLAQPKQHFDVGIAYLGPGPNKKLKQFSHKFNAIITLDAPIAGLVPTRTVDLSRYGFTRWDRVPYPHMLFIYEFSKR